MYPYPIPFWKEAPFLRLLLPLLSGICFQKYLPVSFVTIVISLLILWSAFFVFYLLPISRQFKFRFIQSAIILLLIFFTGIFLKSNHHLPNQRKWYGHYLTAENKILIRINETPSLKPTMLKVTGEVKAILKNNSTWFCKGYIMLCFKNYKNINDIKYGDFILVNKCPQEIRQAFNPGSFDYKQYLSDQQIYHQLYLKDKEYVKLNYKDENKLFSFVFSLKAHILSILKKYIHHTSELGIAEALLIGYKNDLDNNIVQAYSQSGVVHIIAISGLHLGLIYLLLIWLIDRAPFIKNSKVVKFSIVIACLWIFSLLTGCSASVLRSAVMFTCMAFGKLLNKETSIYNSLAASAFILLCYNPNLLWDAGFQLSYLAIIGIVLLQKPIQQLVLPSNKILIKVWEMISITLAAQIFTFPICLYYFHQFPALFLISNLISVPLSTLILFMEIALISISNIPFVSNFVGVLTEQSIRILNQFISFISGLSFSNIDNIQSNLFSTTVLYGFLFFLIVYVFNQKKVYLKWSLVCLTVFCCCMSALKIMIQSQRKIIFYNCYNKNVIDFVEGDRVGYVYDLILQDRKTLYPNVIMPARKYYGAFSERKKLNGWYRKNNLFQFQDKLILIIDSSLTYKPIEKPIIIDFMYVSNNPMDSISNLLQVVRPKMVLFAANNKSFFLKKWKQECDVMGIAYFSIKEKGAYVCDVNQLFNFM